MILSRLPTLRWPGGGVTADCSTTKTHSGKSSIHRSHFPFCCDSAGKKNTAVNATDKCIMNVL